jgi:hypothetical protein
MGRLRTTLGTTYTEYSTTDDARGDTGDAGTILRTALGTTLGWLRTALVVSK